MFRSILIAANWDGFHDNETDIWGYTWAVGEHVCEDGVVEYEDPHSHLADKTYWSHQGYAGGLVLSPGTYYTTVQALNEVTLFGFINSFSTITATNCIYLCVTHLYM